MYYLQKFHIDEISLNYCHIFSLLLWLLLLAFDTHYLFHFFQIYYCTICLKKYRKYPMTLFEVSLSFRGHPLHLTGRYGAANYVLLVNLDSNNYTKKKKNKRFTET